MEKVAEIIEREIAIAIERNVAPPKIHLEAGYFEISEGITEFSMNSLNDMLNFSESMIKKHKRNVRISLGILINNIHKNNNSNELDYWSLVPKELHDILSDSPIFKKERFVISTEKRCKNRGANRIKKILKQKDSPATYIEIKKCEKTEAEKLYFPHPKNNIFLGERSGSKIVVKCPVITAQNYLDIGDILNQRFGEDGQTIIVDVSSKSDSKNVKNGTLFAKSLSCRKLKIINVFYKYENSVNHSISVED